MESKQNCTFQYTYSAAEQEEIKRIRSKYLPKEENKLDRLRRLDASVTQKATVYALVVGVIGSLILGTGMSCCLVWGGVWFLPGIIIGLAGLAMAGAAYPLYERIQKKERQRLAPEILRLSEELMK